jgi:hypothetical protein
MIVVPIAALGKTSLATKEIYIAGIYMSLPSHALKDILINNIRIE